MLHTAMHCSSLPLSAQRQPSAYVRCTRATVIPVQCSSQPLPSAAAGQPATRRNVLGATCAVLSLMSFQGAGLADTEVPKAYQEFAFKLVHALEDSILADLNGAEEREVRRTADPAKNLVREFVQRWRDAPVVRGEESHRLIQDTIQQLGQFYQTAGGRARLPQDLGQQLLEQLHAAEEALPPLPDQKLFPFF